MRINRKQLEANTLMRFRSSATSWFSEHDHTLKAAPKRRRVDVELGASREEPPALSFRTAKANLFVYPMRDDN